MKPKKTFDCVEMKNAIQAQLREEKQRLGEAEVMRRHRLWLQTCDDPLARWWRSLPPAKFPRQTAKQSRKCLRRAVQRATEGTGRQAARATQPWLNILA